MYYRKIVLNEGQENVLVVVKLNGVQIHSAEHSETFTLSFEVKESSIMEVYFNGVKMYEDYITPGVSPING